MTTTQGRLSGRTAVVTGAGRNIGRAIALRLAAEGANVALVGRTRDLLERTAEEIRETAVASVEVAVADIAVPADVESAITSAMRCWGRVDILVNNAGVVDAPDFMDVGVEDYRRIFDTNVLGTILMSQAAARHMVDVGGGVIVHLASVDARGADGGTTVYSASKAAVASLARTMAVELASVGIRVNSVSPGWVRTEMVDDMAPRVREYMLQAFDRVPIGRLVEADEIAATVAYLASDDASGITGADVTVDGGLTSNLYVVETLPPSRD